MGIRTLGGDQIIYVDTPGMHLSNKRAINRYMNHAAKSATSDVDLIIFVTDRTSWTDEDELVAKSIEDAGAPAILVINKIDLVPKKTYGYDQNVVSAEKIRKAKEQEAKQRQILEEFDPTDRTKNAEGGLIDILKL